MKRIYLSSIIALLTLTTAYSVQAQSTLEFEESTPSPATRRESVLDRVNETTEERQQRREELRLQMAERRAEFEDRVAAIEGTQKQTLIERIDEKVNDLNTRHTGKLESALTRMQTVLDSIETKAASAEANGADTTGLEADIAAAQDALDSATASVEAQISNDYVVNLTDEENIRASAQEVFTLFREDIQATHMAVKDAYTSVVTAARSLAQTSSTVPQAEDEDDTTTSNDSTTRESEEN